MCLVAGADARALKVKHAAHDVYPELHLEENPKRAKDKLTRTFGLPTPHEALLGRDDVLHKLDEALTQKRFISVCVSGGGRVLPLRH